MGRGERERAAGLRSLPNPITPRHPIDPSLAADATEREAVLASWDRLFTMSPYEVASLYKGSDDFELIHAILKGGLSRAGNVWHYRVFFEKEHLTKWARSRFFLDRTLHHQVRIPLGDTGGRGERSEGGGARATGPYLSPSHSPLSP